jgi:hypothetical protein
MAGNSDKKVRLTGESIRDWQTTQRTGERQISIPNKRDGLKMFMIGKPLKPEALCCPTFRKSSSVTIFLLSSLTQLNCVETCPGRFSSYICSPIYRPYAKR